MDIHWHIYNILARKNKAYEILHTMSYLLEKSAAILYLNINSGYLLM